MTHIYILITMKTILFSYTVPARYNDHFYNDHFYNDHFYNDQFAIPITFSENRLG